MHFKAAEIIDWTLMRFLLILLWNIKI